MAADQPALNDGPAGAFAARKRVELLQKLAGVTSEFASWRADAEQGKPLRKHQSQIERLVNQLGGMASVVEKRIAGLGQAPADVFAEVRAVQMSLLEIHRLWDYFRVKLNLRFVPYFRDYLAAADDLAWECYEPVRTAAGDPAEVEHRRAAPLVFLSGDFSPYTHARARPFEVERLPHVLDSEQFRLIASSLPVPVIGVPWYQVAHLPDAPLIGHEVGHDLAAELDLTVEIEAHAAPVLNKLGDCERMCTWKAWLPEVHADLVGLMCTGPAFASAMMDLLAADPLAVADEAAMAGAWNSHPPAALRVRVLAEALALQDFPDEGAAIRAAWEAAFPPGPRDRYGHDAPKVVAALWKGCHDRLGGTLAAALAFTPKQQLDAVKVCSAVLNGDKPRPRDVRALVAGARLAFDADPTAYHSTSGPRAMLPQQLVLERLLELRDDAPRAAEVDRDPGAEKDRATGAALFDQISTLLATEAGPTPGD